MALTYMYIVIAKPLYELLVVFMWIDECENSFNKIKVTLSIAPIFKALDWNLIFHVCVDA